MYEAIEMMNIRGASGEKPMVSGRYIAGISR
jgi:hypothetical protein